MADLVIVKAKIKEFAPGFNIAGDVAEALDSKAKNLIKAACERANANGRKQTLNNTAPCTRVESGGLTTFTINLAATSLFGTGALAENVTVEVTQDASPYQTVYADVTRSGSASISVIFSGSVAADTYRVLLEYV